VISNTALVGKKAVFEAVFRLKLKLSIRIGKKGHLSSHITKSGQQPYHPVAQDWLHTEAKKG